MKKVIALILAALFVLSPVTIFASENSLFVKMAQLTKEERAEYFSLARPFFTNDAGVSAALENLGSDTFLGMFKKFLGDDVERDFLKRMFLSVKCVKEETNIRLTYADIIQNKTPLSGADSETLNGVGKMLDCLYRYSPEAKKVMTEDGYTTSVVANILTLFPAVNGGPSVVFKENNFSSGTINKAFADEFNAVWSGYEKEISASDIPEKLVAFLQKLPNSEKYTVAKGLKKLGICEIVDAPSTPPQSGASGTTGEKPDTNVEKTNDYTVIKSGEGLDAEIFKNSLVIKTQKEIPPVINVVLKSENPLVKKLNKNNELEIVTYSIPTEDGVMLKAEPDTVYVISTHIYPFKDASGWGKDYIAALNARGIINGKEKDMFMPDDSIKREEFIKLVVALFGLLDEDAKSDFTDVSPDAWYAPYVASAAKAGITSGLGDGSFGVGKYITRQDMAKIIGTVLDSYGVVSTEMYYEFNDSDKIAPYAEKYVQKMANLKIISGDDQKNFNPKKNATRQEAAKMIYGMLKCYILNN